jgi:GR25 family glycosyltransferase involved in LPS biosynthesis
MKIIFIVIILIILFIFILINKKDKFNLINDNSLHKYFDKIVMITLSERKGKMEELMNKYKIYPEYFPAIRKKNINYQKLIEDKIVNKNYYKKNNHGRIACHLSHITVLKDFLKSKATKCLIFEDDNNIDISYDEFNNIINNSMKDMPNDWDIIYFSRCGDNCTKQEKIKDKVFQVFSPFCRNAYAVTRKCAKILIENTLPMINNGDVMYNKLIRNNKLKAYTITPNIIFQDREKYGTTLGNKQKLNECKHQFLDYLF